MTPEEYSALMLSLRVGLMSVIASLPFAIGIAYILARWNFPLRWLLQAVVDLPLVLPPVVTGYLLLILFSPNGRIGAVLESIGMPIAFSWFGAVVAAAVVSFPLMVRSIRGAIQSVDQRLELTARSLGANKLVTFLTITLPLARHGIIAGCILAFARSIGEFGATIMLAGDIPDETRTIPLAIYSLIQRVGGMNQVWLLVLLSILLAVSAVVVGEIFEHRWSQREQY